MANPKLPIFGLIHTCLRPNAATLDEAFGVGKMVCFTRYARTNPKPKPQRMVSGVARVVAMVLKARLSGRYKNTPLFNASGAPAVAPRVLEKQERAALYR